MAKLTVPATAKDSESPSDAHRDYYKKVQEVREEKGCTLDEAKQEAGPRPSDKK